MKHTHSIRGKKFSAEREEGGLDVRLVHNEVTLELYECNNLDEAHVTFDTIVSTLYHVSKIVG